MEIFGEASLTIRPLVAVSEPVESHALLMGEKRRRRKEGYTLFLANIATKCIHLRFLRGRLPQLFRSLVTTTTASSQITMRP